MKQTIQTIIKEKKLKCPEAFNIVSEELAVLEENLSNALDTQSLFLKEIISYIFSLGGKRFRPALCLLIAKATGFISKKHIMLSEITELIHTASLIHDDIIDSAKLRRGKETINNIWNDKISVITGDFLFAQASIRLGELENTDIVKIYAKVLSDLCDGEIKQYSISYNTNISWKDYLRKSRAKTASLFAACCKSSAILNNQPKEIITKADDFGNNLGIAFQIVDDILDFTSTSYELGKEVYTDLRQGIITAPVLLAINTNDERAKQIKTLIENHFNNNDLDFDKSIRLIHELGGCEKAKQLASEYITNAKEDLSFVKDKELKSCLIKACDHIIERT